MTFAISNSTLFGLRILFFFAVFLCVGVTGYFFCISIFKGTSIPKIPDRQEKCLISDIMAVQIGHCLYFPRNKSIYISNPPKTLNATNYSEIMSVFKFPTDLLDSVHCSSETILKNTGALYIEPWDDVVVISCEQKCKLCTDNANISLDGFKLFNLEYPNNFLHLNINDTSYLKDSIMTFSLTKGSIILNDSLFYNVEKNSLEVLVENELEYHMEYSVKNHEDMFLITSNKFMNPDIIIQNDVFYLLNPTNYEFNQSGGYILVSFLSTTFNLSVHPFDYNHEPVNSMATLKNNGILLLEWSSQGVSNEETFIQLRELDEDWPEDTEDSPEVTEDSLELLDSLEEN